MHAVVDPLDDLSLQFHQFDPLLEEDMKNHDFAVNILCQLYECAGKCGTQAMRNSIFELMYAYVV